MFFDCFDVCEVGRQTTVTKVVRALPRRFRGRDAGEVNDGVDIFLSVSRVSRIEGRLRV